MTLRAAGVHTHVRTFTFDSVDGVILFVLFQYSLIQEDCKLRKIFTVSAMLFLQTHVLQTQTARSHLQRAVGVGP